jgi:hypothetical protein
MEPNEEMVLVSRASLSQLQRQAERFATLHAAQRILRERLESPPPSAG